MFESIIGKKERKGEGYIDLWIPVIIAIVLSFIAVIAGPFVPLPLVLLGSITIIKLLYDFDVIKDVSFKDYIIIAIVGLLFVSVYLVMLGYAFTIIPLWKLILVAVIADVVAFILGVIKIKGYAIAGPIGTIFSVLTAIVVFFIVYYLLGKGLAGILLGGLASAGSMLAGPIPFTLILFIVLYLLSRYIVSHLTFLRWFV